MLALEQPEVKSQLSNTVVQFSSLTAILSFFIVLCRWSFGLSSPPFPMLSSPQPPRLTRCPHDHKSEKMPRRKNSACFLCSHILSLENAIPRAQPTRIFTEHIYCIKTFIIIVSYLTNNLPLIISALFLTSDIYRIRSLSLKDFSPKYLTRACCNCC